MTEPRSWWERRSGAEAGEVLQKVGPGADRQARVLRALLRYPEASIVGGFALLAVTIWALAYYQPWLSFTDREIHEARPRGAVFASAGIRGTSATASGQVTLLERPDGQRFVRIERLEVENARDLRVRLATASGLDAASFADADMFDLGELHGNVGDLTYEIPGLVDLRRFRSVVIVSARSGEVIAFAPFAL